MTQHTEHTPGPWRQKDVQPDAWTRQVWTDESHGSVMIATTGGIDKDANARLIAAAPELLAALQDLVCCPAFTGEVFSKDKESHRAWTLSRIVIAKATGNDSL